VPPGDSFTPPSPPPGSTTPGGGIIYPSEPRKDPVLVLILNLLILGGVGYIIMGQKRKGILTVIACVIIAVPTCGSGSLLIAAVTAVDGYLQAQQLQQGHPVGEWTFFKDHR
jgi:hypothetical protein